jgi:hypothetical protein
MVPKGTIWYHWLHLSACISSCFWYTCTKTRVPWYGTRVSRHHGTLTVIHVPWYRGTRTMVPFLVPWYHIIFGTRSTIEYTVCTENHVCFGRLHGSQLREGAYVRYSSTNSTCVRTYVRTRVRTRVRTYVPGIAIRTEQAELKTFWRLNRYCRYHWYSSTTTLSFPGHVLLP